MFEDLEAVIEEYNPDIFTFFGVVEWLKQEGVARYSRNIKEGIGLES